MTLVQDCLTRWVGLELITPNLLSSVGITWQVVTRITSCPAQCHWSASKAFGPRLRWQPFDEAANAHSEPYRRHRNPLSCYECLCIRKGLDFIETPTIIIVVRHR